MVPSAPRSCPACFERCGWNAELVPEEMEDVYRGVDTELRRFVAVKTLPGLSVADEARLRRES